jgi:cytochrome P450
MRRECPVAWTNRLGTGAWAITRYDDVAAAARDTATFSSRNTPRLGPVPPPVLEAGVAAPVDVAERFTYPFPARVLCELLRISPSDYTQIKRWSDEVFNADVLRGNDPARKGAANEWLRDYGRRLIQERRAMQLDPAEDLVTGLVHTEIDGQPLDPERIVALVRLLLSAGHNSTTSSLGIIFLHLARDPRAQRMLRQRPELISAAVAEFLRHESPVMATPRTVARDAEFRGQRLGAGEQVFLVWSSANRDGDHIMLTGPVTRFAWPRLGGPGCVLLDRAVRGVRARRVPAEQGNPRVRPPSR